MLRSIDVHIMRIRHSLCLQYFLGVCVLWLLQKKKRRRLTIFNNPDEECFISLRLSSAGVYIACVSRTLSLKWATGASPLRCLLACFDPWWVGEPPESFFSNTPVSWRGGGSCWLNIKKKQCMILVNQVEFLNSCSEGWLVSPLSPFFLSNARVCGVPYHISRYTY